MTRLLFDIYIITWHKSNHILKLNFYLPLAKFNYYFVLFFNPVWIYWMYEQSGTELTVLYSINYPEIINIVNPLTDILE